MKLNLGIGVGNFKFGLKESKVKELMRKPDDVRVDKNDDNRIVWTYNKEKLRLVFYKDEDKKLAYIETANPKLSLNQFF